MSREKLFKNNRLSYYVWWNKKPDTIFVTISDENDIDVKKLKVVTKDYIIVPPGATLYKMM